jgi:hypothetical protein
VSLGKRLAELERKFTSYPMELIMPDGQTALLREYTGEGLLNLFGRAMQEMNAGIELSPDVALIKKSVAGTERGGCMIELVRALSSRFGVGLERLKNAGVMSALETPGRWCLAMTEI